MSEEQLNAMVASRLEVSPRLVIRIQPEESILLRFQAKQPGPTIRLSPVDMRFCYEDAFKLTSPEAYETLLWDVMMGDATLFMRADQVEAAWSVITPILEAWDMRVITLGLVVAGVHPASGSPI